MSHGSTSAKLSNHTTNRGPRNPTDALLPHPSTSVHSATVPGRRQLEHAGRAGAGRGDDDEDAWGAGPLSQQIPNNGAWDDEEPPREEDMQSPLATELLMPVMMSTSGFAPCSLTDSLSDSNFESLDRLDNSISLSMGTVSNRRNATNALSPNTSQGKLIRQAHEVPDTNKKLLEAQQRRAMMAKQEAAKREDLLKGASQRQHRAVERKAEIALSAVESRQRELLRCLTVALMQLKLNTIARTYYRRLGLKEFHLPRMRMMGRRWLRRVRQRLGSVGIHRPTVSQLQKDSLLGLFAEEHLRHFIPSMTLMYCFPNEPVIICSSEGDECYVLARGTIDIICSGVTVAQFKDPGAVLGAVGMLTGEPRTATATARGDTWLWVGHRQQFESFGMSGDRVQKAMQTITTLRQQNLGIVYGRMLHAQFLKSFLLFRDVTSSTLEFLLSVSTPLVLRPPAMLMKGVTKDVSVQIARNTATQQAFLLLRGTLKILYCPAFNPALYASSRTAAASADGTVLSLRELVERFVQFPVARSNKGTRQSWRQQPKKHHGESLSDSINHEAVGDDSCDKATVVTCLPCFRHLQSEPTKSYRSGDIVATIVGPALINMYSVSLGEALPFSAAVVGDCDAVALPRSSFTDVDLIDLDNVRHGCHLLHEPFVDRLTGSALRRAVFCTSSSSNAGGVARIGGTGFGPIQHILERLDHRAHAVVSQQPSVVLPLETLTFHSRVPLAGGGTRNGVVAAPQGTSGTGGGRGGDHQQQQDSVAFIVLRGELDGVLRDPCRPVGEPYLWPDVSQVYFGLDQLRAVAKTAVDVIRVKRSEIIKWITEGINAFDMELLNGILTKRCTEVFRGHVPDKRAVDAEKVAVKRSELKKQRKAQREKLLLDADVDGFEDSVLRRDSMDDEEDEDDDEDVYNGPLLLRGMQIGGARDCKLDTPDEEALTPPTVPSSTPPLPKSPRLTAASPRGGPSPASTSTSATSPNRAVPQSTTRPTTAGRHVPTSTTTRSNKELPSTSSLLPPSSGKTPPSKSTPSQQQQLPHVSPLLPQAPSNITTNGTGAQGGAAQGPAPAPKKSTTAAEDGWGDEAHSSEDDDETLFSDDPRSDALDMDAMSPLGGLGSGGSTATGLFSQSSSTADCEYSMVSLLSGADGQCGTGEEEDDFPLPPAEPRSPHAPRGSTGSSGSTASSTGSSQGGGSTNPRGKAIRELSEFDLDTLASDGALPRDMFEATLARQRQAQSTGAPQASPTSASRQTGVPLGRTTSFKSGQIVRVTSMRSMLSTQRDPAGTSMSMLSYGGGGLQGGDACEMSMGSLRHPSNNAANRPPPHKATAASLASPRSQCFSPTQVPSSASSPHGVAAGRPPIASASPKAPHQQQHGTNPSGALRRAVADFMPVTHTSSSTSVSGLHSDMSLYDPDGIPNPTSRGVGDTSRSPQPPARDHNRPPTRPSSRSPTTTGRNLATNAPSSHVSGSGGAAAYAVMAMHHNNTTTSSHLPPRSSREGGTSDSPVEQYIAVRHKLPKSTKAN